MHKALESDRIRITALVLTILLYLLRSSIPALKYPFVFLLGFLLILYIPEFGKISKEQAKRIIYTFSLSLILASLFFISLILSPKIYLSAFKDLLNTIILIFLFFVSSIVIRDRNQLYGFYNSFKVQIIFFAGTISFFGLLYTFDIFNLNNALLFGAGEGTNVIIYDSLDYNFALLPVFFAILILTLNPALKSKTWDKYLSSILLLLLTLYSFLSGSKRGIFILFIFILVLVCVHILNLFYRGEVISMIVRKTRIFLISLFGFSLLIFIFFSQTSYKFKYNTFRLFGISNVYQAQNNITLKIFRYNSIFNNSIKYRDFYRNIWTPNYDPKDPDSGWGTSIHKSVYPLIGTNSQTIPSGTIGYMLNSTVNPHSWNGNAYSYTAVTDTIVNENDGAELSVYCYVSEDFDGNLATISASGSVHGILSKEYDFRKKGTWQHLSFTTKCNAGKVVLNLSLCKFGVQDFSGLKGYVVFAYPQLLIHKNNFVFNPKEPATWLIENNQQLVNAFEYDGNVIPKGTKGVKIDHSSFIRGKDNILENSYYNCFLEFNADSTKKIRVSIMCFVTGDFSGDQVRLIVPWIYLDNKSIIGKSYSNYDLLKKGIWQKLEIEFEIINGKIPVYLNVVNDSLNPCLQGSVIFAYPVIEEVMNDNLKHLKIKDKPGDILTPELLNSTDPIRRIVSAFVNEDTVFFAPEKVNLSESEYSTSYNDRTERWKFAKILFTNEFNYLKKLFGGGFSFLNWYGYSFLEDKTASDWPHNPFLSILLYSGILGLSIYCFFLYKVFYYYIKYIKEYPLLFIFFLITFFFSFFSGGSPFDPPIMGFFSILPFFIHSVHKRDKMQNLATNLE